MIQSKNLLLRAIEPSDIDLLYEWENNTQIWEVSQTLTPFSKYQLQKYIKHSSLDIFQTKQLRLMIDLVIEEKDNVTVGMIDLFDFEPFHSRAGVGILIHKDYQNHKIASEALTLFVDYSFKQLSLHQLYCNILVNNKASIQLFTKAGFEICGTRKQWIKTIDSYADEMMLQLINASSRNQ